MRMILNQLYDKFQQTQKQSQVLAIFILIFNTN